METRINTRIDSDLKSEAELILKQLGMTSTELVRMTFRQLVMRRGLPFDVKIPNAETLEAMEELRNPEKRKHLKHFDSVDDLMKVLEADD